MREKDADGVASEDWEKKVFDKVPVGKLLNENDWLPRVTLIRSVELVTENVGVTENEAEGGPVGVIPDRENVSNDELCFIVSVRDSLCVCDVDNSPLLDIVFVSVLDMLVPKRENDFDLLWDDDFDFVADLSALDRVAVADLACEAALGVDVIVFDMVFDATVKLGSIDIEGPELEREDEIDDAIELDSEWLIETLWEFVRERIP